jgi:hypothetical protein
VCGDTCDHSGLLDRSKMPDGMTVEECSRVLRCSSCGSREVSIGIVSTGANGFAYGGLKNLSSLP